MPVPIKIIVSLLALALCTAMFFYDHQAADPEVGGAKWVALLLGPLMVGAIWVFPEAKKREVSEIRSESAKKAKNG